MTGQNELISGPLYMADFIDVRKMHLSDAPNIARLSHELDYPTDTQSMSSRLDVMIDNDDHCLYVAVKQKSVLGWIHAFRCYLVESDPFVEIGGLVVSASCRGEGIGKALVKQVINWAQAQSLTSVRVRCQVKRKQAHRFYLAIGFEHRKTQKIFETKLKTDS